MKTGVFLLLGTNLGDRLQNLADAHHMIGDRMGKIIKKSSLYRTAAWGKTDQPDFLNQVIELETSLSPFELLATLLDIEQQLGRTRTEAWGARTLDIDILLFGDETIETPELTIPHPQMIHRKFTLIPLAEIAGAVVHPVYQKNIRALLALSSDTLAVTKFGEGS